MSSRGRVHLLSLNKDKHLQFFSFLGSARLGSAGSAPLLSETRAKLSLNNPDMVSVD